MLASAPVSTMFQSVFMAVPEILPRLVDDSRNLKSRAGRSKKVKSRARSSPTHEIKISSRDVEEHERFHLIMRRKLSRKLGGIRKLVPRPGLFARELAVVLDLEFFARLCAFCPNSGAPPCGVEQASGYWVLAARPK